MLKGCGHTVIHYGHEDSVAACDEHVTVTTLDDPVRSYGDHDWRTKGFPNFQTDDHVYKAFSDLISCRETRVCRTASRAAPGSRGRIWLPVHRSSWRT
jgi:hypothetical protein